MPDVTRYTETLDKVLELTVAMNDDMTAGLDALGLTTSRTHLLWVIRQQGPATQRTLADALGVSPRNITGLVDGLVETGFVTREPHPTDRRATLVSFTAQGSRVMQQMGRDNEQFATALFAPMADDELDAFRAALDGVVVRLQALTQASAGQATTTEIKAEEKK